MGHRNVFFHPFAHIKCPSVQFRCSVDFRRALKPLSRGMREQWEINTKCQVTSDQPNIHSFLSQCNSIRVESRWSMSATTTHAISTSWRGESYLDYQQWLGFNDCIRSCIPISQVHCHCCGWPFVVGKQYKNSLALAAVHSPCPKDLAVLTETNTGQERIEKCEEIFFKRSLDA